MLISYYWICSQINLAQDTLITSCHLQKFPSFLINSLLRSLASFSFKRRAYLFIPVAVLWIIRSSCFKKGNVIYNFYCLYLAQFISHFYRHHTARPSLILIIRNKDSVCLKSLILKSQKLNCGVCSGVFFLFVNYKGAGNCLDLMRFIREHGIVRNLQSFSSFLGPHFLLFLCHLDTLCSPISNIENHKAPIILDFTEDKITMGRWQQWGCVLAFHLWRPTFMSVWGHELRDLRSRLNP